MIPHREASAVSASSPAKPLPLILPDRPGIIPDAGALVAAVAAEIACDTEARQARAVAVRHLSEARTRCNAALAAGFAGHPRDARALVRAQSDLTDALVTATLQIAMHHLHPLANPTEAERVAVLAVGGYGRAEMAPHSDVDLLFLTPWKITPWAESVIESMLYMLWDLRLKVGHASRTVKDCLRLGREDITIRTALLEHRFVAGHAPL
ncbi:MAG: [protein-PII] uridylyltransferase, partial [Rhodobacter sp.]|nr:[protein-PII] uridylyltransferase [Rhodobacter sp.]